MVKLDERHLNRAHAPPISMLSFVRHGSSRCRYDLHLAVLLTHSSCMHAEVHKNLVLSFGV